MDNGHEETVVWGVTEFWSETGTEGGYWAVMDIRGVNLGRYPAPGSYSYYGLLLLEDGDRLTIFDRESITPAHVEDETDADESVEERRDPILHWNGKVLWDGEIKLREHPVFKEHAHGLWIHNDLEGVDRSEWAKLFIKPHPCRLVTRRAPWPLGRIDLSRAELGGLYGGAPVQMLFMSDGSVRWNVEGQRHQLDYPPFTLRQHIHRLTLDAKSRKKG